ncbi:MAG: hypothetical protein JRJ56_06165 [Deltaproteobacteria bacterium]|nr:hypothetical protein [Deltaproteobacteria bacterium]
MTAGKILQLFGRQPGRGKFGRQPASRTGHPAAVPADQEHTPQTAFGGIGFQLRHGKRFHPVKVEDKIGAVAQKAGDDSLDNLPGNHGPLDMQAQDPGHQAGVFPGVGHENFLGLAHLKKEVGNHEDKEGQKKKQVTLPERQPGKPAGTGRPDPNGHGTLRQSSGRGRARHPGRKKRHPTAGHGQKDESRHPAWAHLSPPGRRLTGSRATGRQLPSSLQQPG